MASHRHRGVWSGKRSRCATSVVIGIMLEAVPVLVLADCALPGTPNDGYFDQTWGGAGLGCVVFTADNRDSTKSSALSKLAVAPNADIFMGGSVLGGSETWWIGELTASGAFDSTFGDTDSSGRITACQLHKPSACPGESYYEFLPQPDNRILIVSDSYLTRTSAGGRALDPSIDGTAGGGGIGYVSSEFQIATPTGYAFSYFGAGLALTSGGKILMGGTGVDADATNGAGYHTPAAARINTDLSLDKSFNAVKFNNNNDTYAGGVFVDTGSDAEGHQVLTQSTGKLILISSGGNDFRFSRLNADGSLDTGFGTNGTTIVNSVPSPCTVATWEYIPPHIAILDRADRIIAAGECAKGSYYNTAVVRLTADGAIDTTFGANYDGFYVNATFGACPNLTVRPRALAIDSAGRILVGGICDSEIGVQRLRGDKGILDTSFGIDGLGHGHFDPTSPSDEVDAMMFDAAGHLFIGGQTQPGGIGSPRQSGVARLTYDLIFTNNLESTPDGCQQPNCT